MNKKPRATTYASTLCAVISTVLFANSAHAITIVNYRMQETNPTFASAAADSSGFGNTGKYLFAFGGPGSITDTNDHPIPSVNAGKQFNIAFNPNVGGFTGAHIELDPSPASIAGPTNAFSIEFLMKPQADTFSSGLLALYANNGQFNPGDLHMNISGSNLEFAVSGHLSHPNFNVASLLPVDEWGHVVFTYGSGLVSLYINGDLVGSQLTPGVAANIHNLANIGAWIDGGNISTRFYRGGLDEFSIYNTTLTADEVNRLAQAYTVSVPEPVVLPVVALGFLAMSARRRSRLV